MEDQEKKLAEVVNFLKFENETSLTWPWVIPVGTLIQSEELLLSIALVIHVDETGSCDTEELYDAIDRIVGINPMIS